MDEERMAVIADLADKIITKEALTEAEEKLYNDIMRDVESYKAFQLYKALTDMPGLMVSIAQQTVVDSIEDMNIQAVESVGDRQLEAQVELDIVATNIKLDM